MSTALCPRLVALDPSVCNSVSCRSSHTHEPAFCDPCKAVHAAVHAGIHGASIGHRLRVDGPVAPVRCIVCSPLSGPPAAPFVFIGLEHYAAHARTSAHRARLAQLPPAIRSKVKPDFGLGIGRPGDTRPFAYTRSSSTGNPYSPPASRNVTPTPGSSRPGSSMSFNAAGPAFGETPPGPAPVALDWTEYVICALCHTVLPVPSDVAAVPQRNVSGGSDATVRGRNDDDDMDSAVGSVVTTTDNDTEVRKSLVLANHMSTDTEHARRVKFPKFRIAYEKRIARERRDRGEVEEEREEEAPPHGIEFASQVTGTPAAIPMTRSPDQLSLSSLSSSPSVGLTGLDPTPPAGGSGGSGGGGGLFFHQHYRHRRAVSQDSEVEPEPKHRYSRDDDYVMQRQRSKSRYETSSNGSSERAVVSPVPGPRINTQPQPKPQTQPAVGIEPPAYVREHNLPITIPDHLLPFLSPITPSTATPEEELERYGRSPTSEYLRALPIEALDTPVRTQFMYRPHAEPSTSASVSASEGGTTPERPSLHSIPEQPTPAESVQLSPTPSSIRSRPYEPSPSPPPRLAFDDSGKVIRLGSLGWERQTGPMYDDDDAEPARTRSTSAAAPHIPLLGLGLSPQGPSPSPSPPPIQRSTSQPGPALGQRSVSQPTRPATVSGLIPAPISDSGSEDEKQVRKVEEKSVVSGSVGTVQVHRYTLGRDGSTSSNPGSVSSRTSTLPGRTSQYSARSSGQFEPTRSSTQLPAARSSPSNSRSSLDYTRASTLGPNRTVVVNRTTTATRPVAPRTSTGEWAVLGQSSGGFDEFGSRLAPSTSFGGGRQVASLGARPTAEPSWSSGLFNRSPSPLFDTSRPSSSASEASQIIRGFDSTPLDLNLGTPEMLRSPRRAEERSRSPSPSPEEPSPVKSARGHVKQQSFSMQGRSSASSVPRSTGSPVPRSTGSSPSPGSHGPKPSHGVHGPKPSRPFSPTMAWNGLSPATDSSRSSSSASLGEFERDEREHETFGPEREGQELGGEPKSFDEEAFLSDVKLGMFQAIESRMSTPLPSPGGTETVGGSQLPGRSSLPLAGRSTPPLVGRSSSPLPGRSTPRSHSPLARISTPSPERSAPTPPPGRSTPTPPPHTRSASPGSTPPPHGKSKSIPSPHDKSTSPPYGNSTSSPYGKSTSSLHERSTSIPIPYAKSASVPSLHGKSTPTPMSNRPRVSSPLAIKTGPSVRPVSPGPRTGVSDYSAAAGRTRRRARPMGTGSVVGGGGSVVGYGEGSVVGGREESVVGGWEGSEVGGRAESMRTEEEESVVSLPPASTPQDDVAETPADEFGSLLPQFSSRPVSGSAFDRPTSGSVIDSPASVTALRRRVRGPQSIISTSTSEAPSSVVSPLSPRVVAQFEAVGLHVDPERSPTADEVNAVASRLAGMTMDEPSMAIERVDSDDDLTSPIVPPGAPSIAGSLFSRVASPKPVPTKARLGAVRVSTAKPTSAAPGSSVRSRRGPGPAVVPAPAPEVAPESVFSSGANLRRSADPGQMPVPRTRSVFSRGPGSVVSALSGASKQAAGLFGRLQVSGSKPVADSSRGGSSRSKQVPKKVQKTSAPVSDDFDGGLTSSEEEGDDEDDEGSETKTATVDDDGLDHLTESIDEPSGSQLDPAPEQPLVAEPKLPNSTSNQAARPREPNGEVVPAAPRLSGGFGGEAVDQPLTVSPQLMPTTNPALLQSIEGQETMPDEVLVLNPVICDACRAPMPLAKWDEHVAKSGHRRNAARYSQLVFEQTSPGQTTDARERWAEAMRIQPRAARSSEYAFCDICQVFLLRGDAEHFQGRKHYRCVRAAALNDADELESVRGSVSDEEDGPSARAFRGAAAATSGTLGQQVFQLTGTSTGQQAGQAA